MITAEILVNKIGDIKSEMKQTGLWKKYVPAWVSEFKNNSIKTEQDFAEWLQFVYLPNMMQLENRTSMGAEKYIVPQAAKFFSDDVQKGRLLQLLIELDSLL
jgi:uncharacterized protein YqcC (DUF446 family)